MTGLPEGGSAAARSTGFTRRSFLAGAAGAGLLSMVGPGLARPALAATRAATPPGMPSVNQFWDWQQQLVQFGTRYTGSPGHVNFVDWLAGQFSAVPGFRLRTDRKTFHRWLAKDWSLTLQQPALPGGSSPVPVTYYYPYSGTTGPGGVSAPLMDLGPYPVAPPGSSGVGATTGYWTAAAGKIAVVHAPPSEMSLDGITTATGGYETGKTSQQAQLDWSNYAKLLTNPAWNGIFSGVPLLDARKAGVTGVIVCWTGMPDDEVANQYNPFITPYASDAGVPTTGDPGCPALFVGEATGKQLAAAAAGGTTATLTLTADITEQAVTNTLWGWLPGSSGNGESLIINTHTDGPNATEENGALGLLALAKYFARRPHRRDLVFVMVTGHFQLPQFTTTAFTPVPRPEVGSDATSVWLADHPDRWQKALAGLTVEHLGCTMWGNDLTGAYGPRGGYEWGATYACQKEGQPDVAANLEQQAYLDAVTQVNRSGYTDSPVVTLQPTPLYLGEGAPLYAAGLGTVSLVPAPPYLLQAGRPQAPQLLNLDQLDKNLAHAQVLTFARTIEALDRAPSAAF